MLKLCHPTHRTGGHAKHTGDAVVGLSRGCGWWASALAGMGTWYSQMLRGSGEYFQ